MDILSKWDKFLCGFYEGQMTKFLEIDAKQYDASSDGGGRVLVPIQGYIRIMEENTLLRPFHFHYQKLKKWQLRLKMNL